MTLHKPGTHTREFLPNHGKGTITYFIKIQNTSV